MDFRRWLEEATNEPMPDFSLEDWPIAADWAEDAYEYRKEHLKRWLMTKGASAIIDVRDSLDRQNTAVTDLYTPAYESIDIIKDMWQGLAHRGYQQHHSVLAYCLDLAYNLQSDLRHAWANERYRYLDDMPEDAQAQVHAELSNEMPSWLMDVQGNLVKILLTLKKALGNFSERFDWR